MRTSRGLSLYVGLAPLLHYSSASIASVADDGGIPQVGIGAVHPICDPLMSECIPSDEDVQDDIIERLEEDEQITVAPTFIELGELLCESLDESSGSILLRFATSSNETVTAERTSYSEYNGAVFTDGQERKVWRGKVVDPVPLAGTSSRTISMAWATPCDVESFSLKMVNRNPDGTTSITTSVPCAAGSDTDICMVQYEVNLPLPDEPLEPVRNDPARDGGKHKAGSAHLLHGRHLKGATPAYNPEGDAINAQRRRLQTTEVSVMFLYSGKALERLGVSREQMETLIADHLPETNKAAANSLVDLQFNVVHTEELPYVQETEDAATELRLIRENAATKKLRDQYQADMVVLVGTFPTACGRGYLDSDTTADDEDFGFSLIDAMCFNDATTTHATEHNTDWVPRINSFFTPDASYEGLPTGAATDTNARALGDIMEAVSSFRLNTRVPIGCYRDGVPRIMDTLAARTTSMTNEACRALCHDFEYYGTQNGDECFCGDASTDVDLYCGATDYDDVECTTECAGDSGQICGGNWAMSVYRQIARSYVELGCAADPNPGTNGGRVMPVGPIINVYAMSAEACFRICEEELPGFEYFGTQYSFECFCTMTLPDDLSLDPGHDVCTAECAGRSDGQICGGIDAITVYKVGDVEPTPAGDYVELGCAADPNTGPDGARLMSVGPIKRPHAMSAEVCFGICEEELSGFEYFGTQYGFECFCSRSLPDDLSFDPEHGGCIAECAGSSDGEICGGTDAITVYQVGDGEPTTPAPTPDPVRTGEFLELGCAADPNLGPNGGRLMSVGPIKNPEAMSAKICYGICLSQLPGFEYFGTQYGFECFCAMSLPNDLSFDPEYDGCDASCAGRSNGEICGGTDAITVYSV